MSCIRAGSREGARAPPPPPPPLPNPENQFENGAKFLCLKGKRENNLLVLASEML